MQTEIYTTEKLRQIEEQMHHPNVDCAPDSVRRLALVIAAGRVLRHVNQQLPTSSEDTGAGACTE